MSGWIKLHRDLLKNPIWVNSTAEQKVVLITLLLMANHEKKNWEWQGKKFELQPGQLITTQRNLAKICGEDVTRQKTRTSLERFENLEFLTQQSTHGGSLITIVNWRAYQTSKEDSNPVSTHDQPKANPRLTQESTHNKNIYKEFKNDKEKKEVNIGSAQTHSFPAKNQNQKCPLSFGVWEDQDDGESEAVVTRDGWIKWYEKDYVGAKLKLVRQSEPYKVQKLEEFLEAVRKRNGEG